LRAARASGRQRTGRHLGWIFRECCCPFSELAKRPPAKFLTELL